MLTSLYTDYDPNTIDALLSVQEVADALGLGKTTVEQYRKEGKPFFADRGVKIGRALRWRTSDLNAYIASLPYSNA